MELGQNQPMKHIRSEEDNNNNNNNNNNNEADRISSLPDCSIVEILTRLPETKHAVGTTTLSKRWKHVWHSVPNLRFVCYDDVIPGFFDFVDKTLTQRPQLKVNKFVLDACYDNVFESRIDNWIRYAIDCNVEELNLTLRRIERNARRIWIVDRAADFPLDQFVFACSSFVDLTFSGCSFNPTGAVSWKNVRSLVITCAKLDEDVIGKILSGSPVLETLELKSCYGFKRLDVKSESVKTLVISGYENMPNFEFGEDGFEINAPNILSLVIQEDVALSKFCLRNVSSLVEAELDYWHGTNEEYEKTLKGLILSLRHVKVVEIGGYCCKVLNRLEAKGFKRPSNLKVPTSPW
ncbi:F-box protein At5g03100-like [Bidens hawaiensis]|uniref:F-box protein At5g03100-like n=1 Tax=Bidens hawaiensis TaxID=980011 RepID=UPI00404B21C6